MEPRLNRRTSRHTSAMRKTAHGDVTGLTVIYAFLMGLIIAGRWGWGALAVYTVAAVAFGAWWLDRRMQAYRRLG